MELTSGASVSARGARARSGPNGRVERGAKVVAGPVREGKRAVVKRGVSGADRAGPGDSVGEKGDERAVNGRAAGKTGPLGSRAEECVAREVAGLRCCWAELALRAERGKGGRKLGPQ